jgi:hypothetical protein
MKVTQWGKPISVSTDCIMPDHLALSHIAARNSLHMLRLVKEKLKTDVCSIPCECTTGMQGNNADALRHAIKSMMGIYTSATQICSGRIKH